ncbi:apoptotic signal-regulating kinase 1 isoform X2 [Brevipalpus obovatus]|uniref:apoptotic signal-regulating kinase 1 isoform X2 n=2 Tax=Brevipalpus obovatus TaxID=246614 RepID=UPI003D9F91F9
MSIKKISKMPTESTYDSNKHRSRFDVVVIIDVCHTTSQLSHRKAALEEVQKACESLGASCNQISFQKLDFSEIKEVEQFHGADVVIVDLSLQEQQSSLLYQLGVRESFGMKHNIIIYNDYSQSSAKLALQLRTSCANYPFMTYQLNENTECITTDSSAIRLVHHDDFLPEKQTLLSKQLIEMLKDVEVQQKAHLKQKFLADLREAREKYTDEKLKDVLRNLRRRLDDPNLISLEAVHNMFLSFREVQDYDAMVKLFCDLEAASQTELTSNHMILYFYAFALNRRNQPGDREKALKNILHAIKLTDSRVADIVCLCGRIYKDKFIESDCSDTESLKNAIQWYRKSFEVQPNDYAGINLATLLVIDGASFATSEELRSIGLTLSNLIGKKGNLSDLTEYWSVATFMEIHVLAENYGKANIAAECMFKLKPPDWYLKSTIGNIQLINRFRKKPENVEFSPEEQIFNFWMEYFIVAIHNQTDNIIKFPILVYEPSKIYQPSYVTVHLDAEEKSIVIFNVCLECLISGQKLSKGGKLEGNDCRRPHKWEIGAGDVRGVSLYERDDRCLFLYVSNSADFQMFFSSEGLRSRFHALSQQMIDKEGGLTELEAPEDEVLMYDYELDENQRPIVLGRGSYGKVYAARDRTTQRAIAIKEIPVMDDREVQPLHDEIKLHSQLRHRNIVQYLGSVYEGKTFKIFMEHVPGGSLSYLLRSSWIDLSDNEPTMSHYTKQILRGLEYLHGQQIVHRDIKGDNVLVNTYSGVIKISDFGASKRLAGLNPRTETFKGTLHYMAPEVIVQGQRGYGAPADIWSLGCTIVEMATGQVPTIHDISGPEIIFQIGFYRAHPEIPDKLSDPVKDFILRCFEPEPERRATATELLTDPFVSEGTGNRRKLTGSSVSPTPAKQCPDFSRSISVPAKASSKPSDRLTANFIDDCENKISKNKYENEFQDPLRKTTLDRLIIPGSQSSLSSDDGPNGVRDQENITVSPPLETATPSSGESGGFFLLKKDSERRETLYQILNQDSELICGIWLHIITQRAPRLFLTSEHLRVLLEGIREYIKHQKKDELASSVFLVKDELEPDGVNQMQLAFLVMIDAVNQALRDHNIKLHWMFAFDSLTRGAAQAAISILSPELYENLIGHPTNNMNGRLNNDPATFSMESTLTSDSSTQQPRNFITNHHAEEVNHYKREYEKLHQEHLNLWQQFIEAEKTIISLLRIQLNDKNKQIEALTQVSLNSESRKSSKF